MKRILASSVFLLLAPTLASAQAPTPKVLLVPFQVLGTGAVGGSELVAGRITEQARSELDGRQMSLTLLSEAAAPRAAATGGIGGDLGESERQVAPARQHARIAGGLLEMERFEEAMQEYGEAIRLYEGNLALMKPETVAELREAHLRFSVAAMQAGFVEEAEEAVAQVLRMSPEFNPAGKGLPPVYQKVVGRLRKRIAGRGTGVLSISSEPPSAKVFVDGEERGETPVKLKTLAAGPHYVQLLHPMTGVWAQRIDFPGKRQTRTEAVQLPPTGGEPRLDESLADADAAAQRTLERVSTTLRTGLASRKLKGETYELALRTGAEYVLVGYLSAVQQGYRQTGYRLRPMLLRTSDRAMADLDRVYFDIELLGSAAMLQELADRVVAALEDFPAEQIPDEAPTAMQAAAVLLADAAQQDVVIVSGAIHQDNFGTVPRPSDAAGAIPDLPLDVLGSAAATAAAQQQLTAPAVAPVAPVAPVAVQPVAPVAVQPVAPVAPVAVQPVAPVAPVVVQPVAPVAPVVAPPVAPIVPPAAPVAPWLAQTPPAEPAPLALLPVDPAPATLPYAPVTPPPSEPIVAPLATGGFSAPPGSTGVAPTTLEDPGWTGQASGNGAEPRDRWYKRWWVWASAAAVVGGGAWACSEFCWTETTKPARTFDVEVSFR